MNSIKSLATLMILAVVGGYLYLKITETEPVLPPEAADLAFDVPQIDLGGLTEGIGVAPTDGISSEASPFGIASDGAAAPPFDASTANSAAPAWSGSQYAAQTAATGRSGAAPPAIPPPTVLPPESPRGGEVNQSPANPFGRGNATPKTASAFSSLASGDVAPRSAALPPPGSLGASQETVIAGRVYDEPATELPIPPPDTAPDIPPSHASVPPIFPSSPATNPPASPPSRQGISSIEAAFQTVESLLVKGQLAKALRILTAYYRDPTLSPSEQEEVDLVLSQLAGTVIYSTEHRLEPPHRVAPGETLSTIAKRYDVPAALLAKINQLADPNNLATGAELKIVRGPFLAVVDLTHRELTLLLDGRYAGRFPIEVGTEQPPNLGHWVVATKQTDPEYVGTGTLIAGGDPANSFGRQMLKLASPNGDLTGFGIHGSPLGGETDARGSIRLTSADAADVFDILSVGSKVIVRR